VASAKDSTAKMTLTYVPALDNGFSIGGGSVFVLSRFRTDMETGTGVADGSWDSAVGAGFIIGCSLTHNL
jgi:hypothetical protein